MKSFDVVVVGGGITGCSIAYHLSLAGCKVALVEQKSLAWGATGRCGAGVRAMQRDPREIPLATRSKELWLQWSRAWKMDMEYRQVGCLDLAYNEKEFQAMHRSLKTQQHMGVDVDLVSTKEISKITPEIQPSGILGGLYCPSDGVANPFLATHGIARKAECLGAKIFTHCRGLKLLFSRERITGLTTTCGKLNTPIVVNATNAWANQLSGLEDVSLPIHPARDEIIVTEPLSSIMDCFTHTGFVYTSPTKRGNILLGGGGLRAPGDDPQGLDLKSICKLAERAKNLFPALRHSHIIRGWGGWVALTPDGSPLLGPLQAVEGYYIAAGFNGHGFALGPAVGEKLANLILTDKKRDSINNPLTPARFGL